MRTPIRPRNDVRQYDDLAAEWWRPGGQFAMLSWIAEARARLIPPASRPGAVLADLGCGGGLLAPHLAGKGYRHVGVDLTASALAQARDHGVVAVRADVTRLPLADGCADVVSAGVLQELTGAHHVGAAVRQRQPGHVGPDRDHPVVTGLRERRGGQIDADVAVALSGKVRRKQPSPAAEVGEDGAGAGRGRDQAGAGLGDPRQHRELAARAPPLRRQVVVLSYVVPGPNGRPHARQPYTKRYTPATLAGCGRPSRCSERATRSRRRR